MENAKWTAKWSVDGSVFTDALKEIGRLDLLKCPTQVHNFATDDEVK